MSKLQGKLTVKRLAGLVQAVPGQATGKLQEKTVTPSTEEQTVTPDGGYAGMNRVYVEAVQLQAKSVEPSTSAQVVTPDAEYMGLSQVYVGAAPLQQKTATPAAEAQEITPDAGYYGLEKVAVEAAPLQEITITPTSEVQTITPDTDEGYIGFSKITVEAVEYDDSGGDGGGDGEEPVVTPNAGGVNFGDIYTEDPIYAYYFDMGSYSLQLPAPFPGYPYVAWARTSGTTGNYGVTLYTSTKPIIVDGSANMIMNQSDAEVLVYNCTSGDEEWTESALTRIYTSNIHWANHDIARVSDGYVFIAAKELPEPIEVGTTTTVTPGEYEDEYIVSGSELNDIIVLAQKITGTQETMTLEEATKVLEDYYASLNEENDPTETE